MYISKYYLTHKYKSGQRVLVNTLTGTIDPIEERHLKVLDSIENNSFDSLDLNSLEELKAKKYILNSIEEETRLIEYWRHRKDEEEREEPLVFVVYLTYDCNVRCSYCCYNYLKNNKNVMNKDTIDAVILAISKIVKESGRKRSKICLFGGEPFIKENYDIIEYFLERVTLNMEMEKSEGRECRLMIFSNGVEIPSFKNLLAKCSQYIEQILVTLIGSKESHDGLRKFPDGTGTFDAAVKGIETLLDLNIKTWPVTNLDKSNVNLLPEIIKFVDKRGWTAKPSFAGYYAGRIKYYKPENCNALSESQLIEEITRSLKEDIHAQEVFNFGDMRVLRSIVKLCAEAGTERRFAKPFHRFYGCLSGELGQFSFSVNGELYTCSGAMGIEKYRLGFFKPELDIQDESLKLWSNRDVLSLPKCRNCKVAFLCGGGCAYAASEINGSIHNPVCTDAEDILHAYLDSQEAGVNIRYKDLLRQW